MITVTFTINETEDQLSAEYVRVESDATERERGMAAGIEEEGKAAAQCFLMRNGFTPATFDAAMKN
jgi:hypothetical protein